MINSQQRMADELSITMISFGQAICNYERRFEKKSLEQIASGWISKAAMMQKQEWHAGRNALLHYLKQMKSQSAERAIEVLTLPTSGYARNSGRFKCIYRQRKTKPDSFYLNAARDINQAYRVSLTSMVDIGFHGGTMGAYRKAEGIPGSGNHQGHGGAND